MMTLRSGLADAVHMTITIANETPTRDSHDTRSAPWADSSKAIGTSNSNLFLRAAVRLLQSRAHQRRPPSAAVTSRTARRLSSNPGQMTLSSESRHSEPPRVGSGKGGVFPSHLTSDSQRTTTARDGKPTATARHDCAPGEVAPDGIQGAGETSTGSSATILAPGLSSRTGRCTHPPPPAPVPSVPWISPQEPSTTRSRVSTPHLAWCMQLHDSNRPPSSSRPATRCRSPSAATDAGEPTSSRVPMATCQIMETSSGVQTIHRQSANRAMPRPLCVPPQTPPRRCAEAPIHPIRIHYGWKTDQPGGIAAFDARPTAHAMPSHPSQPLGDVIAGITPRHDMPPALLVLMADHWPHAAGTTPTGNHLPRSRR